MNRREMLGASLAASTAVLAGCGGSSAPTLPPGDLIGANVDLGHLLRDRKAPTEPPPQGQKTEAASQPVAPTLDVLIVGGGMAGLSAAWRLKKAGVENFLLCELESTAGGTSRSGSNSVSAFPWGGHYLPVPMKENRAVIDLLDEMKILEGRDASGEPIIAEQFLCRDPQERIFFEGAWREGLYPRDGASAEDLRQFQEFKDELNRWAGWRDKDGRRAFAIPIATCSTDPEVTQLDKISMAEFLDRKGWASPRLRWYVDYACRDDHATRLETTSAWAGLFYFVSRMKKPGADAQQLITWPEGNGRIVAHLQTAVASKIKTGLAIFDLAHVEEGGQKIVRATAIDSQNSSRTQFTARRVIFAAPQFVARYIIAEYRAEPPPHIQAFNYGAWMVANLTLKERPAANGFALCWDNVFYDSPSVGYVVATHQRGIDHGPTVLTYYYPLCDADSKAARARLLAGTRDDWARFALDDISRAHPDIRKLTERIDCIRWGHAMIQPRPGFLWGDARKNAARPFGKIHFGHSDLSGIALFEEAFFQGVRAAEEVLSGT